jgi:hypothetical protein
MTHIPAPVVDELERERDGVGAADREQVALLAEVAQEVDEPADARAAVGVGLGRDAEEGLVGVGRLLVALVARGDLAEVEDVVGLVGVDEGRAAQPREALRDAVLVEVHHREPRDGDGLVVLEGERRAELLDREAEVARAEERRAEERVRARRLRVARDDARRVVVGFDVLALLEQRAAQAQPRRGVLRVFGEEVAVDLLRRLELALARGPLGARPRLLVRRRRRGRGRRRRDQREGGQEHGRRGGKSLHMSLRVASGE